MKLTEEQFEAVATLTRMLDRPSKHAARLVLVEGMRNADASRAAECSPQQTYRAVLRVRSAMSLVEIAAKKRRRES